jgi:hypothetical protein
MCLNRVNFTQNAAGLAMSRRRSSFYWLLRVNLALFAATAPNHTEPPTNSVSATFDPFAPVFPAIQIPKAQVEALTMEILTMEGPPFRPRNKGFASYNAGLPTAAEVVHPSTALAASDRCKGLGL